MKNIAIRADGNIKIGLGHIMRTLVLAEELKNLFNIFYVCKWSEENKKGIEIIKNNGYKCIFDSENYEADLIIIDSYNVDENYFSKLRKLSRKLMYIDDLHSLKYYDVDILLNRAIGAESINYNAAKNCRILLGSRYMILRKEFRENNAIEIKENVENILITFGGSDPVNMTYKVLECFKNMNYNFKVVIGSSFSNENIKNIEKIKQLSSNIELFYNPKMSKVFKMCDIAVTACGGTVYEIGSMAIPQIALAIADNQDNSTGEKESGLYKYAGKYNEIEMHKLYDMVINLAQDYNLRKYFSKRQKEIIDKNGTDKIINEIINLI